MSRRCFRVPRRLLVVGVASALALAAGAPTALGASCNGSAALRCLTVEVPLDRSGRVPGTVSLHVEVLPATGVKRGVMFLLAGGPGQSAAAEFDLGSEQNADAYRSLAPGYTLVAYDIRGTGRSGALRCPTIQPRWLGDPKHVASCARSLGPRRDFYGTADHAEDLEAVRRVVGYGSVALSGVSYGTQLALAYALAHPTRVERLLLDSVAPTEPDPFLADLVSNLPSALERFCAGGACRAATPDFAADVVAVANALGAKPLRGKARQPDGRYRTERLDGLSYLSLVFDSDLSPGLAAALPALTHAARRGNPRPLLRTFAVVSRHNDLLWTSVNVAAYLTTICRDGPFPWKPGTPIGERRQLIEQAVAALPAGALGPFGTWVTRSGTANGCVEWPSPAGGATLGAGPLPDVPVLALSGSLDLRTPTAEAVRLVDRFPQGRLLVARGIGHGVLGSDPSGCPERAVRAWMAGRNVAGHCARPHAYLAPLPAFVGGRLPKGGASPQQTLGIASRTLREAEATWLLANAVSGGPVTVAGLHGGRLETSNDSFRLVRYSVRRGVSLTGEITMTDVGPPLSFRGFVAVRGAGAAAGELALRRDGLAGVLGGRRVRER